MNIDTRSTIARAVRNILARAGSAQSLVKLNKRHSEKVHFIPRRYRVFGGMLQAMNIQFGNFIEELMALLVSEDGKYEIVKEFSGKKNNTFAISQSAGAMIDAYIDECQVSPDGYCNHAFLELEKNIIADNDVRAHKVKHDIDLLFRDINTKRYYYLEIKYNDDHDTGKFVDINRKFIKTYAYLVDALSIENIDQLTPILFYFNNKKMKGNPYVPECTNIRRGDSFFNEFLSDISYDDLNNYMENLSESDDIKAMFDDLYNRVVLSERVDAGRTTSISG